MNCAIHEQTPATGVCASCGQALCGECSIRWQGKITCKECLEAQEQAPPSAARPRKSPVVAGLLSIVPGLGQVYVGYYTAGFVNMIVVALVITLLATRLSGGPLAFVISFLSFFFVFNIIDAARKAQLVNRATIGQEEEKLPTDSPLVGGIVLLIAGVLLTLGITFNVDLEFLETVWPLGVLIAGLYLMWRYRKTRRELNEGRWHGAAAGGSARNPSPTQKSSWQENEPSAD